MVAAPPRRRVAFSNSQAAAFARARIEGSVCVKAGRADRRRTLARHRRRLGPDFEVRSVDGTDRPALLSALADANAVLIRSATKIDEEAIAAAPPRLQVVARAGVGLDNVDIKAATTAGVMVVNAPTSNIISPRAHGRPHPEPRPSHPPRRARLARAGPVEAVGLHGVELYEKTVGIIGLGRIGALIATRLQAFGVEVIAYDPLHHGRARPAARRPDRLARRAPRAQRLRHDPHAPRTPPRPRA